MNDLIPFAPCDENIRIKAAFVSRRDGIQLKFHLRDPGAWVLDTLSPGEYTGKDIRRADGLWKTTCFEAFWGLPGQPGYWELNLSANRPEWNLYYFESLRLPHPPRPSEDYRLHRLSRTGDALLCELETSLALPELDKCLCTVARLKDKTLYFSERHASDKPDFHNRQAWSRA